MELIEFNVQGYKSIRENQQIKFNDFNVLLGENNTGKSSVIDALRDYRELFPVANKTGSEWAHSRNTGKEPEGEIRFEITFLLEEDEHRQFLEGVDSSDNIGSEEIERWIEQDELRKITHELILRSSANPMEFIWGESNVSANYDDDEVLLRKGDLAENEAEYLKYNKLDAGDPEYTEKRRAWVHLQKVMRDSLSSWEFVDSFRNPESMLPAKRDLDLDSSGENLSKVLLTLRGEPGDKFERISKEYAKIMPGVQGIRAPLPYENHEDHTTVVVDEENYDTGFRLDEISAGSKEILTLITQIIQSGDSDVLLIEEPELHLHPGAERAILDLINKELDEDGPQVILSTHSSIFIHHLDVENVYRVKREGDTTITPTSSAKVGADLRELGYEYAGMFQSEGVVVVEGLTDRVALETIGRKYGLDFEEYNIGILEMGSGSQLVTHSRPIVRLFNIFNIPYFFLCDSDIGDDLKYEDEDEGPRRPEAIEGRLVEHINGDTSREENWSNTEISDVHAWENEELEHYLLQDHDAIEEAFAQLDYEDIEEVLEENADEDPDKQLKALCERARTSLGRSASAMDKKSDVTDLAAAVDLEGLPPEFHDTMENIASLVDARHVIENNRPDSGDQ